MRSFTILLTLLIGGLVLLFTAVSAKRLPHPTTTSSAKNEPSDIVRLAQMAKDAALVTAQNHHFAEQSRRQTEERIAMAEIQSKRDQELSRLKEEAFQFKVSSLIKDGMTSTEAMQVAYDIQSRDSKLSAGEQQLQKEREAFESEKSRFGPQYFIGGCVVTVVLCGMIYAFNTK